MTQHDVTALRSAEDRESDDLNEALPHSAADFDATAYRPYLAEFDLTDDEANELLRILWDIMRQFVHLDVPPESWGQIIGTVTGQFGDAATGIES